MTRLLVVGLLVAGAWFGGYAGPGFSRGNIAAQAPKKAYMLVQVDVTNASQYQEYAKLTPGIVAKYGGRYLARAGRTATLEGPPARARVVVIEFPSMDRARAFYDSAEYVAARKVREGAGTAQFVVVEGVE